MKYVDNSNTYDATYDVTFVVVTEGKNGTRFERLYSTAEEAVRVEAQYRDAGLSAWIEIARNTTFVLTIYGANGGLAKVHRDFARNVSIERMSEQLEKWARTEVARTDGKVHAASITNVFGEDVAGWSSHGGTPNFITVHNRFFE